MPLLSSRLYAARRPRLPGTRSPGPQRVDHDHGGTAEPCELHVERIGAGGDGVAQWRGTPVYLPFTAAGDRVRAVLGTPRGGGYEARVVELLTAGSGRADPPCRHFGRCGGCALQHLDFETYRRSKLDSLHTAVERVGIDPAVIEPWRRVAPARRRARLGLMRPREARLGGKIGFRERISHELVDITECLVLEAPLLALGAALRDRASELLPPGGTAEASLTRTDSGIDLLLTSTQKPGLSALEALATLAAERDVARIVWRSPAEEMLVVERRPVRMMRSGIAVPFPPGAFLQASESAEAIIREEVAAAVARHRPALDLYAGLGTFGLALAGGGPVHMVEGDEPSTAALAVAAGDMATVSVERRDLARDPVPPQDLAKYAAAVFDPPRAGAARQVEMLARSSIDTVVAVSCNPATFARDAASLIAGGYHLLRILPIDQFVWSPHLELVAVFRR